MPIAGATAVARLDEQLGEMDLSLGADIMSRLDAAGRELPDPSLLVGRPRRNAATR